MSDSAFPFGGDEPAAFEEEVDGGSNKRVLVMAGGVVAALAVAAGGYFLLGGGGEPVEQAFTPVKRAPQVAQVAATTKKVATTPKLPVPFEEDLGRDPFRALYVQPPLVEAPAAGDPTLPGGGTAPGGAGTPASPAVPAAPDGAPGAGDGEPTAQEFPLVLKRVYGEGKDQTAEFTIGGRGVVAKIGVRFGPTNEIRLISLQEGPKDGQWTAVLQVGDGEPFDAVTGVTVLVR